jgi:GLPGLI family protein
MANHNNGKLIKTAVMFNKLLFTFLLLIVAQAGIAQFITKGKIEYERKTNQHALLDENNVWDAAARKNLPKFITYYFDLSFDNNRTLFKPGRDHDVRQNKFWGVFEGENIIATNLDSNKSVIQKSIYNDAYLITDSLRKIEWKIGTEIRKIAGFDCRKAVGKVLDSFVVIAFYTNEIIPSGGPESFSGLPGMILGVAIPRMHTTWYATKLQLTEVSEAELAAPKKGKKYATKDFKSELNNILKNWGEEGKRMQWQLLL